MKSIPSLLIAPIIIVIIIIILFTSELRACLLPDRLEVSSWTRPQKWQLKVATVVAVERRASTRVRRCCDGRSRWLATAAAAACDSAVDNAAAADARTVTPVAGAESVRSGTLASAAPKRASIATRTRPLGLRPVDFWRRHCRPLNTAAATSRPAGVSIAYSSAAILLWPEVLARDAGVAGLLDLPRSYSGSPEPACARCPSRKSEHSDKDEERKQFTKKIRHPKTTRRSPAQH